MVSLSVSEARIVIEALACAEVSYRDAYDRLKQENVKATYLDTLLHARRACKILRRRLLAAINVR